MLILFIIGFAAAMTLLSRWLRRRDRDGYWDRDWSNTASRPGIKFFQFDDDGVRQRPPGTRR